VGSSGCSLEGGCVFFSQPAGMQPSSVLVKGRIGSSWTEFVTRPITLYLSALFSLKTTA
jgi:hypothetical protein